MNPYLSYTLQLPRVYTWLLVIFLFPAKAYPRGVSPADSVSAMQLITKAYNIARSDPQQSLNLAAQGVKLSEEKGFATGVEKGMRTMGFAYSSLGDQKNAFLYFSKSLEISKKNNHVRDEAQTLFHIGAMYMAMGIPDKAFDYQTRSLKIYTGLKDSLMMADTYAAIAITLIYQNLIDQSNQYLLTAIELYHKTGDIKNEAIHYGYLGSNYLEQKNNSAAFLCFTKSMAIEKTPETWANLGNYYNAINKNDSAYYCFTTALRTFDSTQDLIDIAKMHSNIGSILLLKGDLKKAEQHLLAALSVLKKISDLETTGNTERELAKLYAQKGDYRQAYKFHLLSTQAKDSFSNAATKAKIAELNTKFEVSALEEKNTLLLNENILQKMRLERKNILVYGTLLAFIVSIVIGMLLVRQNRLRAQQQKAELEQKQLRAQMNPHFIFNCLNSIQHFIVSNDVKNANKYLTGFASLMRQTLENSKEGTVTLQKEIDYLDNYITLERVRFEDKFTYSISCLPDINPDTIEIPAMILQPFIENSIRHGLCYLTDRKGILNIRFYKRKGFFYSEIDDNGIGRERSQQLKSAIGHSYESHGIALTRQRMELVSKQEGAEYHIEIRDKQDAYGIATGTTVIIKFPLNS